VAPAVDAFSGAPISSFDGANWVSIAIRAAKDIMTEQITESNISPPNGWCSAAVTVVTPETADIHNEFTIDPGLIRIRMMHGYMRADDTNNARWLAAELGLGAAGYLGLVDEVSKALFTTQIVQKRYEIWLLEHAAL
jgi:hypothetical protein